MADSRRLEAATAAVGAVLFGKDNGIERPLTHGLVLIAISAGFRAYEAAGENGVAVLPTCERGTVGCIRPSGHHVGDWNACCIPEGQR